MPGLVNYRGDSSLLFSLGSHLEVYCPPRKRSRIIGPSTITINSFKNHSPAIDKLPNECLFEIFRKLPNAQARSSAACVSKRWLTVLSSIRRSEFCPPSVVVTNPIISAKECSPEEDGHLTRCVEGKKATDLRLMSIAVGTSSRGSLGKLSIHGSNALRGITNHGLSAIARGCPSLRVLSLWDLPLVGDEGLAEIARECHGLEKLDICNCPSISDKGLAAIAESSPDLTSLTVEGCLKIGNEGLSAVAKYCPKLKSITLKDCPLVGDKAIACLFSSPSNVLSKVRLQGLRISDYSVAVIGHYGKALSSLILAGLQDVSEKGFWVMGNGKGLRNLSSFSISSCKGMTNLSIEALGNGCPKLKHFSLRKCCFVSDEGLVSFAEASNSSLESLQLEECNRISHLGVLKALSRSKSKLKSISLVKCVGINDLLPEDFPTLSPCESLRSLTVRSCPGFGTAAGLAMVGKLCPRLNHLDLDGLTDGGLISLLECLTELTKANLGGCPNLTDRAVLALARLHGGTLRTLSLDGCLNVTDRGLEAIAGSCPMLDELDVSKCSITDSGVVSLSRGVSSKIRVLSLCGCSMITNASVSALEKMGKEMAGMNLQRCNSLSASALEMLAGNIWRCDVLF